MSHDLRRVAVLGTSGSGKSTLAIALAGRLGCPRIELDALHWLPGWRERPDAELRALVTDAVAGESWIVDGNYPVVQDLTLPRATAIVWIDLPFPVVFARAMRRTVRRVRSGEEVCNGNRERLRNVFLHPDGVPYWVVRSYATIRRRYTRKLLHDPELCARTIRLRTPGAMDRFVGSVGTGD